MIQNFEFLVSFPFVTRSLSPCALYLYAASYTSTFARRGLALTQGSTTYGLPELNQISARAAARFPWRSNSGPTLARALPRGSFLCLVFCLVLSCLVLSCLVSSRLCFSPHPLLPSSHPPSPAPPPSPLPLAGTRKRRGQRTTTTEPSIRGRKSRSRSEAAASSGRVQKTHSKITTRTSDARATHKSDEDRRPYPKEATLKNRETPLKSARRENSADP